MVKTLYTMLKLELMNKPDDNFIRLIKRAERNYKTKSAPSLKGFISDLSIAALYQNKLAKVIT